MTKRDFIRIATVVLGLLCIPLVGNLVSDEVEWGMMDFIIGFILLFTFGTLLQIAFYKLKGSPYRILILLGILMVLILIWAELAVGVFGSPWAGS